MTSSTEHDRSNHLDRAFFEREAAAVAPELIGATLLIHGIGGTIVEVEAYDEDDPASHSHRGLTPRNAAMFGPPGHLYIYQIYGLHWCLNLVCGPEGSGSAVLIRALEPVAGIDRMFARRDTSDLHNLCAGPGRLCQALGVDRAFNGLPIDRPPVELWARHEAVDTVSGPRIGISRAKETAWRFSAKGSTFLSRPVSNI